MNNPLAKKIIIITAVVLTVVLGAVILALATGNTRMPSLSDPKGIFYERLDENGKVIYSITNEEIYEQIKSNNGITQLLMMVDTLLLSEYLDQVTNQEIEDKIKFIKYGTSKDDEIAKISAENLTELEDVFERSMILSGYLGRENEYARLLVAREKYAREILAEELTEIEVATAFISSYFEDMKAINIRFTSREDALAVLAKFNLAEVSDKLALYKGFTYTNEALLDNNEEIVEAYKYIETYYFDENGNILNFSKQIVYTKGSNDFYTDSEENSFSLDNEGNLINDDPTIIISKEHLFESFDDAKEYRDENIIYYYMSRVNPYDKDEDVLIKDADDVLLYRLTSDGKVFDAGDVDVTSTHKLIFNKNYRAQANVTTFTSNNTSELTEEEILNYYILMYNFVYGEYRELLPENATKEELIALENEFLSFNFDEVNSTSTTLATYMFKTISQLNNKEYSSRPQSITMSSVNFFYMTHKLEEPQKFNLGKIVLDLIEQSIVLPENVVQNITLPTTGEYGSTITWTSADRNVISNAGVVTTPSVATKVDLSYSIRVLGETRTGKISVNVLPTGENSAVVDPQITYPALKTLINNQEIYDEVSERLLETKVYGSNGSTNVSNKLISLRKDVNFVIYDYYLGLDYKKSATTYEINNRGHKTLVASMDRTLTSDDRVEITADDLHTYTLEKNPSVYTLYAAQFKEVLYSDYFEEAFGSQRNIKRNNTDRMDEMYTQVANSKQYYSYMKNLYAQYGMQYPYKNFSDYAYAQYGTKTELALIEYFITRELQPYLIDSVINQYNVVEALLSIVEDNFNNYFSLDVVHLLIFIDFDEDGRPDDFKEYMDNLTTEEVEEFNSLLAQLEIAINEFEGTFTALVDQYIKATRTDEIWGAFKQKGIILLTEDLNVKDSEEENVTHSLTYSGEYGTKDSYAKEFTQALISLYQEYQLPQNTELSELYSDLVITDFGIHLILVKKGDDFDKFSAKFTSSSPNASLYPQSVFNENDMPTLQQLQLYATYKFYEMVYDLTDADVEEKFNITIPKIPASVAKALDFYFDGILNEFYVLGTVNVKMAQLLESGNFLPNDYTNLTHDQILANLKIIETAYFDAILGKYID